MIGQTISHSRILEKLRGGGAGVVYKVQEPPLDRSGVLNPLPSDDTRDPEELSTGSTAGTMRRRKRLRLADYDYSEPAAYFVTMCTKDRVHLFGEIVNGVMRLNRFGGIVQECWTALANHFSAIELDEFVIMPNHVHGIIVIVDPVGSIHESIKDDPVGATSHRPMVETGAGRPRPYQKPTLGQMVAYFKYQSTKCINTFRGTPGVPIWQRNYFDHIIRNDKSLHRIRDYIAANPQRWQYVKENVDVTDNDEFDLWLASEGRKPLGKKMT